MVIHDKETGFPKKFCQIRWTANASVADAALKVYDNVCKFVKEENNLCLPLLEKSGNFTWSGKWSPCLESP